MVELPQIEFPDLKISGGTLYIVSTPIGNLEDISFRAIHVLKNVDLIAAEDTRTSGILLHAYGIKGRLMSYYSHTESQKLDYIIGELKSGKSVALISDAGTPCVSDPGSILVSRCVQEEIEVVSIPGASSLIHSLVLSGFSTDKFYYQGFLPVKKGRETTFKELKDIKMPIIIFESPFRVFRTLEDIQKHFGNKEVSLCRELTKKFEEIKRGRVKEILQNKNSLKIKGEFVIIVNNQ
ncbi:MAG: 16S rRNA (cytidine(1402)-2'-O)-methyltransferase [Bacteroidetes bacterium]|nr:16S rRNA (cytidine(1402)-2'-O)-methyltransferase [Bacteroidota bacterium]